MSVPNNPPAPPFPLLMTRPQAASNTFVRDLPDDLRASVHPVVSPLMNIVQTDANVRIGPTDGVIFTSSNGVRYAPDGSGRRAFCIGDRTAGTAVNRGWNAHKSGNTADELVLYLTANPPNQRLVHLSGTYVRGNIVDRLSEAGITASRVVVYDQEIVDLTPEARAILAGSLPVLLPLFSPRTAEAFFAATKDTARVAPVALSATVADCVPPQLRAATAVAEAPNADAMIKALDETVQRLASG